MVDKPRIGVSYIEIFSVLIRAFHDDLELLRSDLGDALTAPLGPYLGISI